jgi:DNA mismatch repair protein MutL
MTLESFSRLAFSRKALESSIAQSEPNHDEASDWRLLGQAFGVFILFEAGDSLWFLDQHAAHERMIFDRLSSSPMRSVELLIPVDFESASPEEDDFFAREAPRIAEAGFGLERTKKGSWSLVSHPEGMRSSAEGFVEGLRSLRLEGPDPTRAARAMAACRSAIKEGEELDPPAMEELIRQALLLPEKRCPHGRPVFFELRRAEAYERVKRIVR